MLKTHCIGRHQQPGEAYGTLKVSCGSEDFCATIRRNNNRVTVPDAGQVVNIKPIGSFADIFFDIE